MNKEATTKEYRLKKITIKSRALLKNKDIMAKPKTRQELEEDGILLNGAIVPEWFKPKCDGCSVPGGLRWMMKANQGKAACVIHDWDHFCVPIAFNPGNILREHERIRSDYQLKINRAKVAKNRFVGRLLGMFYFRGVRFGGSNSINKSIEQLLEKAPPTRETLKDLVFYIETYYPDLDREWFEFVIENMSMHIND